MIEELLKQLVADGRAKVVSLDALLDKIEAASKSSSRLGVPPRTGVKAGPDGNPVVVKRGQEIIDGDILKRVTNGQLQEWAEAVGVEWQEGFEERVLEVWASDERVDRDGDIVEQSWRFENYERNPVVLWGHEWSSPPIGSAIKWDVKARDDGDYKGKALRLVELFAPPEVSGFADGVLRLAKAGFLRTGSVGFYPGEVIDVQDDEARAELGLGAYGFLLRDNELLEHSFVTVPANPGAHTILSAAKSAGLLRVGDVQIMREAARQDALILGGEELWKRYDSALRKLWRQLYPKAVIEPHADVSEPVSEDGVAERKCLSTWKAEQIGEPVSKDEVLKPFPGEHACRLADPDDFSEFRRVNEDRESDGKQIDVIYGHLKDSEDWAEQAYRYPVADWTEAAARTHCEEHDGILFEPAEEEESTDEGKSQEPTQADVNASQAEVNEVVGKQLETLSQGFDALSKQIEQVQNEVADLRSDLDQSRREHAEDQTSAVRSILSDISRDADKALGSEGA